MNKVSKLGYTTLEIVVAKVQGRELLEVTKAGRYEAPEVIFTYRQILQVSKIAYGGWDWARETVRLETQHS